MAIKYGIPYRGSKNDIAEKLIEFLPSGNTFYDIFCGGGAMTHCAIKSGKYKRFVLNDIDANMSKWVKDTFEGKENNRYGWVNRGDFDRLKDVDPFVKCLWSFGNNGRSYLYGKEYEETFKLAHMMITAPTVKARRLFYKQFMNNIRENDFLKKSDRSTSALVFLERLERVQNMKIENKDIEIIAYGGDYQNVKFEQDGIIYCDIPYKNTEGYKVDGERHHFDYERFYKWCEKQTLPVYVSEYWMPPERFKCVFEVPRLCHMKGQGTYNDTMEKIFVPLQQTTKNL